MAAPFATSDRLFDYKGPQPYGASPVCTPFADIHKELEWQKCQLALGRPVDIAALFYVVERADEAAQEKIDKAEKEAEEEIQDIEEGKRVLDAAIEDASRELTEACKMLHDDILNRINAIDRNVVAKVLKTFIAKVEGIRNELVGAGQ